MIQVYVSVMGDSKVSEIELVLLKIVKVSYAGSVYTNHKISMEFRINIFFSDLIYKCTWRR